jgi:predicted phage terminase large subunit-like protein
VTDFSAASAEELAFLDAERRWMEEARIKQILPMEGWSVCLALSGRGFGKTKMGASWVRRQAGTYPGSITHVIAPTYADLRGVVFEGPSGLKAEIPPACIKSLTYSPYPEMILWNGSIIRGFSSETPDRLRGPQATFVWGDELASWYKATEALDNINFSTRIALDHRGRTIQPQKFYTTTPRPLQWLAEMIKRGPRMVYGSTYENRKNLAESFFEGLVQYEGTQIGKQELHGELLDISEAAIIKKSWLRLWKTSDNHPLPWLEKIYVSMDTAFTEKTFDKKSFEADPTCCTVWGVFKHERKWNLLLLECWEDWLGFPELIDRARKEMQRVYGRREVPIFKPLVGKEYVRGQVKKPDIIVIEDKGSGISLRQMLETEKVPAYPYNPGKADKLARVHAVSHLPKAGRIWVLESENVPGVHKQWIDPLIDQLCVYSGPGTTPHDDWVDSTSQAWRVFADEWVPDGVNKLIPIEGDEDREADMDTHDGAEIYVYDDRAQVVSRVRSPRGAYDG